MISQQSGEMWNDRFPTQGSKAMRGAEVSPGMQRLLDSMPAKMQRQLAAGAEAAEAEDAATDVRVLPCCAAARSDSHAAFACPDVTRSMQRRRRLQSQFGSGAEGTGTQKRKKGKKGKFQRCRHGSSPACGCTGTRPVAVGAVAPRALQMDPLSSETLNPETLMLAPGTCTPRLASQSSRLCMAAVLRPQYFWPT